MDVEKSFEGKNIFLTGGSGFVGKALIEKILRSIPNVGKIYVLMRSKKNKLPQERLKKLFENKVFERLREENPSAFEKVVAVEGDIQELELGIKKADWEILKNNVNVIYHCAACVRFDDHLTSAILTNVRSTREIIKLAMEAKHLKAFIHVSTAFCNINKRLTVMEEKFYPRNGDWRQAIDIAEQGEKYLVDTLTQKYKHPSPNTYTFTKALAEHLVNDMCLGRIPTAIVRPTVVINSFREPIPGWTDNFNGPIALSIASTKGIIRIHHADPAVVVDFLPVDAAVNVLLLIACETMQKQNVNYIEVYNASREKIYPQSTGAIVSLVHQNLNKLTIKQAMWYPKFTFTTCRYQYFIEILILLLPALLTDLLLKIAGEKPRLVKIHRKVYIANVMLKYFMMNTWIFTNGKVLELENKLLPTEYQKFGFSPYFDKSAEQLLQYINSCLIRIDADLLNIKEDRNVKKGNLLRLWILDIVTKIFFSVLFIWLLNKFNVFGNIYRKIDSYISSL